MSLDILKLASAALAGGGIGFLSGLFGIGGGFLLVPALNIALGIPMEFAVGSGVCQVLGPATTALLARQPGWDLLRLPLTITGGLFVGVISGAEVLQMAKETGQVDLGHGPVPLADLLVLSIYFLLMLSLGILAIWEARAYKRNRPFKRGWIAEWSLPPHSRFCEFDGKAISIPLISWFGLVVGFLAGLLGMSGGLILIPGLIYLWGLRTQQAMLSSLVIVWIVSLQATVAHAWNEFVSLPLVMVLLAGGTTGARFGSELSLKLVGRQLRFRFGCVLLIAATIVAARLVKLLVA